MEGEKIPSVLEGGKLKLLRVLGWAAPEEAMVGVGTNGTASFARGAEITYLPCAVAIRRV